MLLLIIGLILFVGLVVVHEYGHFVMARRNGVEVEEFGIGFPPRAFGKKTKGGWLFSINWLPIGGFVKLKGEHDSDTEKGSFGAASLGAKSKIMVAGVAMNLITAFVLLSVVAILGMPKLVDNQFTVAGDTKVIKNEILVGGLEKDSPASKAGLKRGDQIISITDGKQTLELESAENLPKVTEKFAGKTVEIAYSRDGARQQTQAELRTGSQIKQSRQSDNPKGYLGVFPAEYSLQRSTWSAPVVAAGLIKQFTELTFKGLGTAIGALFQGDTAKASKQVAGPVGIFVILKDGSLLGYQFILLVIAIISLTLAIMNLLPIPALDGGRLWLTLFTRGLLRKPLSPKREEFINASGFMFLMALILLITVVDVRRFF